MDDAIYQIRDGRLVRLVPTIYDSEALLQRLVAEFPSLFDGGSEDAPAGRLLLVTREMPVPDAEGGPDRWSLDHLFVDRDGVPTLVEVKRSRDPRARREVVAQMLDYAVNAVAYLPVERIRAQFEARCAREEKRTAHEVLAAFLADDDLDPETFWSAVARNLESARVRLIFIADAIPPELARIVAFLDERLEGIDVLAFEIRRYKDAETGLEALVPRQIAGARTREEAKTGEPRRWDEKTFFAEIERRAGATATATARRLFEWAGREDFALSWGAGARTGTFGVKLETSAGRVSFFHVTTKGTVQLVFDHLARLPSYRTEAARWALAQELNRATGASIREDQMNEWPSIDLELLAAPAAFDAFCAIYKRLGEEAKRPEARAGAGP